MPVTGNINFEKEMHCQLKSGQRKCFYKNSAICMKILSGQASVLTRQNIDILQLHFIKPEKITGDFLHIFEIN